MPRNSFSLIILILVIAIPLVFLLGFLIPQKDFLSIFSIVQKEQVLVEQIPGSKFHSPDATWWGYNQSKIVRYKDKVFSYYIDNDDDSNKTQSRFVILKKDGENKWQEGAKFLTSRPGNLLIDKKGILHAFVFEPFDVVKNDSWGKIVHYWFPYSPDGDIINFQQEIVVDNDGKSETANIRVGAAISEDDTMAISFGLTKFNPKYKGQSEHIYFKKPEEEKWNHVFIDGLEHDFYYPFTFVSKSGFHLLPVQDDYNDDGSSKTYDNIYQKILYLNYQDGMWNKELVADLSNHPMAKVRPRLLEQEDLYVDKKGTAHILYKEFLDEETRWKAIHKHVTRGAGSSKTEQINPGKEDVNWVRIFEIDNALYYLYVYYDSVYVKKEGREELIEISIPKDSHAMYPYIATVRGGTRDSERYIDILLLAADQYDFKDGANINYYIRIPKTYLTNLF